jgi:hypothetical protein
MPSSKRGDLFVIMTYLCIHNDTHISVIAVTGQAWNCGSIPGMGKGLISSPKHPDWFWNPSSFMFDEYQEIFLRVKVGRALSYPLSHSSYSIMMSGAIPLISHMPYVTCTVTSQCNI